MDIETALENCLSQYQPVRPKDLMSKLHQRKIKISRSQLYRYANKLSKAGKLDRKNGIWYYSRPTPFTENLSSSNKRISSWESLKKALAEIGGYLTDIEVEKRRSDGTFDKITVQGIIMLAGAKTMQEAAKIIVPDEYEGFLLTQASVNEADKLTWQDVNYQVKKIEPIYDVYVESYRIAKLVKPHEPYYFGG